MKKEQNVARLWVDNLDYQSNTVIIAELVLRGGPSQFTKLPEKSGGFFVSRTCRKFAFVNGREAKKATKRKAVR
jgi:hypothetical protein